MSTIIDKIKAKLTPDVKEKLWSSMRHALTAGAALVVLMILQDLSHMSFGSWDFIVLPAIAAVIRFVSKFVPVI